MVFSAHMTCSISWVPVHVIMIEEILYMYGFIRNSYADFQLSCDSWISFKQSPITHVSKRIVPFYPQRNHDVGEHLWSIGLRLDVPLDSCRTRQRNAGPLLPLPHSEPVSCRREKGGQACPSCCFPDQGKGPRPQHSGYHQPRGHAGSEESYRGSYEISFIYTLNFSSLAIRVHVLLKVKGICPFGLPKKS